MDIEGYMLQRYFSRKWRILKKVPEFSTGVRMISFHLDIRKNNNMLLSPKSMFCSILCQSAYFNTQAIICPCKYVDSFVYMKSRVLG